MSGVNLVAGAVLGQIFANIPSSAADVVGVYDSNSNQLFAGARPIRARIKDAARYPEHPLESGASIGDHRYFEPREVELSVILDPDTYPDAYAQVQAAYQGIEPLTVQTRVDIYQSMFIQSMPHDETAEVFDTVTMIISLKEVVFVTPQVSSAPTGTPADATKAKTVARGAQQGTAASPSQNTQTKHSVGIDINNWLGSPI